MQEMKHRKRMPRVLRGAAIAAAMVMALAVTAGAVNVATDGEFFRQFTIVWTSGNQYLAQDNQGNEVYVTVAAGEPVTKENGRLILHAQGEEIDITEAMEARKLILRHCPDRVHTILPGIVLMDALTEALCEGELYISPYGVREGYLCHKLLNAGT